MGRYSKPLEGLMEFGFVDIVETLHYTDGRKALVIHFNVQPPKVPETMDFDDFGLRLEEFKDNKATYFVDWDEKGRDEDEWDEWGDEEDFGPFGEEEEEW